MNIVGLGAAGCRIADRFSRYPQYQIYKFDRGLRNTNFSKRLPEYDNPEEYEEKFAKIETLLTKIIGEVLFVCGGSGTVSGASLRILEILKRKNEINIVYIRPDLELLTGKKKLQERVTFNVFQQYARSGLFKNLYLVDNTKIENLAGGISVHQYFHKINDIIVDTFHMMNVYKNSTPAISTLSKPEEISKISTFGVCDLNTGVERLFFDLKHCTDKIYYCAFNEKLLQEDQYLFRKIKETFITKTIKTDEAELIKKTFGIYSTDYEQNYIYCAAFTKIIQADLLDN
jgi:hypothetical protein